jgi:hypothetical protein
MATVNRSDLPLLHRLHEYRSARRNRRSLAPTRATFRICRPFCCGLCP